MSSTFTVEKVVQIWDDDTGDCYEIGPDRDCLGLIEIRYRPFSAKGTPQEITKSMTFSPEIKHALAAAILNCQEQEISKC